MDELASLRQLFLEEAIDLLEASEKYFLDLEKGRNETATIDQIFRLAHSLKGSAKAVEYQELAAFTHALESLLVRLKRQEIPVTRPTVDLLLQCNDALKAWIDALKLSPQASYDVRKLLDGLHKQTTAPSGTASSAAGEAAKSLPHEKATKNRKTEAPVEAPSKVEVEAKSDGRMIPVDAPKNPEPPVDDSIRVKLSKVDDLVNEVGELVILQTVLKQQKIHIQSELVQKTIDQLTKITRRIQDNSLRLRMVPLRGLFQKMQRVVRDTSHALGKNVIVEFVGEDNELDKTIVDKLGDPLTHLVRNAVDHGIESAQDRERTSKPAEALIRLSAEHQGGSLLIQVADDGRGIDPELVRKKAIEKGLISESDSLSREAIIRLLFEPGFSTKSEVSEFSGRGVGLDVVHTNISELKGEIHIESEIGKGTLFKISIPMTFAIIEGIVVRLNDFEKYVIPLFQVKEIVEVRPEQLKEMGKSHKVFVLHEITVPVYRLSTMLNRPHSREGRRTVAIVTEVGQKPHAFLVDQVINQQQVVIKKFGADIGKINGVSGSAILGDGRAAPIVDLHEIVVEQCV